MRYAITGHRPHKTGGYSRLALERVEKFAVQVLTDIQPEGLMIGMALGWDQACAKAAIELGIPWMAATIVNQESGWPEQSQEHYRHLLRFAEYNIVMVDTGTFAAQLQRRNEYMVDWALGWGGQLLVLWDGNPSGTWNTIRYALNKHALYRNAWDMWLESQRPHLRV